MLKRNVMILWTWIGACIWLCFLHSAVQANPPTNVQTDVSASIDPILGGGDLIRLYVASHPSLNKPYQINLQGEITLPFEGQVRIEGLNKRDAARLIQRQLTSHYRGLQGVRIVIISSQKFIWLRGWVKKPGLYTLKHHENIGELLGQGGGSLPGALLSEVWLHTPGQPPRVFNLLKHYRDGKKHHLPPLQRGTVVFVPLAPANSGDPQDRNLYLRTNTPTVAVLGAVVQPGVFPSFWDIDLMQALAMARGLRQPAGFQEILIIEPNKPARWFDLRDHLLQRKAAAMPKVKPGSIVFVPLEPLGVNGRGPIRVMGRVNKPGEIRGETMRDLFGVLAASGGTSGDADLHDVRVVYHGSNFTISQSVDLKRAMAEGRMDRIPPTPAGSMIVHIPSRRQTSAVLSETIGIIQLVVSVASVVTTTVALVLTLNQTRQTNNPPQNP